MTAYLLVILIAVGFGMIGLGVWYYGPNGPDSDSGHPERCAACDAPLYGLVRVHWHSENGKDATR